MNIKIHEINEQQIAEIEAEGVIITSGQDALDIMANLSSQEAKGIIIHEYNLPQDFFALNTGVAGEILQKFSQYLKKSPSSEILKNKSVKVCKHSSVKLTGAIKYSS